MSTVKTQPKLKVHVLCSGIRYGNGEVFFREFFKTAWLQSSNLQYCKEGNNLLPTIHVVDLARLVRRVVQDKPAHPYIFAIDRSTKPTLKRIFQAISSGIGNGNIETVPDYYWTYYGKTDEMNILLLNLKFKQSEAFKDGEPPEDAEDPEEAAK